MRRTALAFVALITAAGPAATTERFVSGDVRVTAPSGAVEPAVAIDPVDPARIVIGTTGPDAQVGVQRSTDGGSSWERADLPLGNTAANASVAWSSNGRFAFATALAYCAGLNCELCFYRSADGGASWSDLERDTPGNPRRSLSHAARRAFLHVDTSPGSRWRDQLYVAYDEAGAMRCARSGDAGHTWRGVAFPTVPDELGSGADVTTDRTGTVFVAWAATNSRTIRVRRSTDGGASFGPSTVVATTLAAYRFPLPAQELRQAWLNVSAASDNGDGPYGGSTYLAWTDATSPPGTDPPANHARVQVARSRDGGTHWSVTTPHPVSDALDTDRFHPALAVGADGTVHVVFYDTRQFPARTGVDLYYAASSDGAQTWSAPRRISAASSPHLESARQFGDYNGLDLVLSDLLAGYSDNRSESGEAGDSADVYAAGIAAAGARPAAGTLLGAEGTPGPPLTLARHPGDARLELAWAGACGAADDYAIYEGALEDPASAVPLACTTAGATAATITPAAGQRFYLVVPAVPGAEGSYGRDSFGRERAAAAHPCLPQSIAACP